MVAESESSGISPKKLRANRRNARKSTGPRSVAGKERAAQNAIRHGAFCEKIVLDGEDAMRFKKIRRDCIGRLRPQDALELSFVERVAEGNWRLLRLQEREAHDEQGDLMNPSHLQEQKILSLLGPMLSPGGGRLSSSLLSSCLGARSGIGYLIWTSWQVFQVEKMYVGLLVSAVLGFASAILLNYLEKVVIPWKVH